MKISFPVKPLFVALTLLWLSTLNTSAQSNKVKIDTLDHYIEFGSGGGITGQAQGHMLTYSGNIYTAIRTLDNEVTVSFLKKIKKSKAKRFFKAAQKQISPDFQFNEPGNRYQYLYLKTAQYTKKIVWGSLSKPAPKQIIKLSTKLQKLIV
ncbi:MAG: hypothetical protein ACTHJT_00725 [Cytophaga sp.]|uniref:hypothetical protein n=1 Tax=Cytophaga sp. TaxID=29535 RepID=UPI003F7D9CF4